ncbi:bleomycin resistance family protein [Pseudomonas brassicacearum]|uniref:Bleomycin resistance protein n=1 Tax=Pseudomonas brassicacearum TaxID=930166 RepID=A0A423H831_9PSED|nr:VOC family protein [Pseudomonas brassicacearum]RON09347.1 bleomycin resistance family protein [Pseudomonas brassicacearum]
MFSRNRMVPELMVGDLRKSLDFWTTLIGFQVAYDRPEEGFAYLDFDGVQVMLEQYDPLEGQWVTGPLEAPFGRGINFQMTIDSVEPILQRLTAVEWPLFRPFADAWYRSGTVEVGQLELLVQDPDGYLLRLVEYLGERPLSNAPTT